MPEGYAQVALTNSYEFAQGTGYVLPEYPFVPPPEVETTAQEVRLRWSELAGEQRITSTADVDQVVDALRKRLLAELDGMRTLIVE